MTNESTQEYPHSRAWFLVGWVAVFVRAIPNLRFPIGMDQATFAVIGEVILQGQLPYRLEFVRTVEAQPSAVFCGGA